MEAVKRAFRVLGAFLFLGGVGFVAAQFGNASDARNTAVSGQRSFERLFQPPPEVMTILRRACYDCHSQETRWPWYSHLPGIGTSLEKHVNEARREMNFSDWNTNFDADGQAELMVGICETVTMGTMPLREYRWAHPQAAVSQEELKTLCNWTAKAEARLLESSD